MGEAMLLPQKLHTWKWLSSHLGKARQCVCNTFPQVFDLPFLFESPLTKDFVLSFPQFVGLRSSFGSPLLCEETSFWRWSTSLISTKWLFLKKILIAIYFANALWLVTHKWIMSNSKLDLYDLFCNSYNLIHSLANVFKHPVFPYVQWGPITSYLPGSWSLKNAWL